MGTGRDETARAGGLGSPEVDVTSKGGPTGQQLNNYSAASHKQR